MNSTTTPNFDLRNAKVLVVDDDPVMRDYMETALKNMHVQAFRVCADGFSALKVLASFSPTVILTDIHMKPIDGFMFVRQLHSDINPVRRAVPVIFMSSDSSPETLRNALPLGVSGFIVKPPCPDILRAKMLAAIQGHK